MCTDQKAVFPVQGVVCRQIFIVNERVLKVKKTIEGLQKQKVYKESFDSFSVKEVREVPEDVAANWIDQLTIKQFNEELKDVFP